MPHSNEASGASKTSVSEKRLLSKVELAQSLGFSKRTIDTWVAQKRIPYLRLSRRLLRFDLSKVEQALNAYEIKAAGARRLAA